MIYHDAPHLAGIPATVDVFRNGPLRYGLQLLVHHGDALLQRVKRIGDMHRLALVNHLARVHLIYAEQALHQGGFARAVFPHQGVYRAGPQPERNVVQRLHAREFFADSLHFQQIFRHVSPFFF